jgi:predicted ATP-dependent serine protease
VPIGRDEQSGTTEPVGAASVELPELEWLPTDCEAFGAGLAFGECWLVHGPGGSGKSRLCLRWASRAAALVVSLEMPAGQCARTAASAGAQLSHLTILEHAGWREHVGRRRVLVFDSVSECRGRTGAVAALQELRAWAHAAGGLVLAIAHETTDGRAKGGEELRHEVDAVARITRDSATTATVAVVKRRAAPLGTAPGVPLGSARTARPPRARRARAP